MKEGNCIQKSKLPSVVIVSFMEVIAVDETRPATGQVADKTSTSDEEETALFVVVEVPEDERVDEQLNVNDTNKLAGKPEAISVGEQMQIMCDLYGFKQDTYWDCYRSDQKDALRNKLSLIVSNEFVSEKNLVIL